MIPFQFQCSHPYIAAIALGGAALLGYRLFQWSRSRQGNLTYPSWVQHRITPSNLSRKQLDDLDRRRPRSEWNTVIFFRHPLDPETLAPLNQLMRHFETAKVSLHICVHSFSLRDMSALFLEKWVEGVEVIILTDFETWTDATEQRNSELKMLYGHGIDVRVLTSYDLRNNQFSIIDGEAAVQTGSLNWTNQGVRHSNGNAMITTDPRITSKYIQQFDLFLEDAISVNNLGNIYTDDDDGWSLLVHEYI